MDNKYLYRAKRIDNGKFVQGYLCFIYVDNEDKGRMYSPETVRSYDVLAETIGRCTELKDKNGKLIFEADIVLHGKDSVNIIIWREGGFFMRSSYSETETDDIFIKQFFRVNPKAKNGNDLVVIGNIYDNIELLKGKP